MKSEIDPCDICVVANTGVCTSNLTCSCINGYTGPTCSVLSTVQSTTPGSQINVGIVVASGLGGALLTLVIGLVFFFIWKRRVKKKLLRYTPSVTSSPPPLPPPPPLPAPIVVPALYDIALSRRGSSVTVSPPLTYHYYEETL